MFVEGILMPVTEMGKTEGQRDWPTPPRARESQWQSSCLSDCVVITESSEWALFSCAEDEFHMAVNLSQCQDICGTGAGMVDGTKRFG